MTAEGGSWSCIDGQPTAHSGEKSRQTAAGGAVLPSAPTYPAPEKSPAQAAEEALLARADELYEKREFSTAAELLDGRVDGWTR